MTTATGDSLNYTYDPLHRLKNVAAKNSSGTTLFTTAYAYKVRTNGNTTPLVEFRNVRIGTSGTILEGKKYAYDAVGNITGIYESQLVGNNTERRQLVAYTYDEQNQLLSETYYTYSGTSTTPATTDVYSYTYDTVGNILTESKNGTVTKDYTYSTGDWKDLLTEFNGEEVTYDGAGNPLAYANSTSWYYFRWDHGRNLRFATVDNAESYYVGFDYDTDGIRTKKSVTVDSTGITTNHNYITQNGKVVRETIIQGTTTRILDFIYDESGRPFAMRYSPNGGTTFGTYYYVLNLQGDVVKLITSGGTVIANYEYNAWGELLSVTNSAGTEITTATHVGLLNPLRYRGYYYDTETGFYYLQSRYYDPVTHRFINADSYASTGQGIIGNNMFTYCLNSPIVLTDLSGTVPSPFVILYQGDSCSTIYYSAGDAISIAVSDNFIYIDAYMTFSGNIDSAILIAGIKEYWEGEYLIDGRTKTVVVNIYDGLSKNGYTITVDSVDENGHSTTYCNEDRWKSTKVSRVVMRPRYEDGDNKNVGWSMAHEFGHCLGVMDYYTFVDAGVDGYDYWYNSIFNRSGMYATYVDIQKVLTAFIENSYQTWG